MILNRRVFLCGSIATTFGMPLAVEAQQAGKIHRLAWLTPHLSVEARQWFFEAMRERGWIEGQEFTMEFPHAPPADAELVAAELVRHKIDVMVTSVTGYAAAARRASTVVPIVMVTSGYPVEAGLAESLRRPGGNVTGNTIYAGTDVWGKKIQLLREVIPTLASVALLWDYLPPAILKEELPAAFEEMERASQSFGVGLRRWDIRTVKDFDMAAAALATERFDAALVTSGPVHGTPAIRDRLQALLLHRRLPAITDFLSVDAGVLLRYGANRRELTRRAAYFVDRILRGAKPGDLPIERPTKFDLVINLKTARALGLAIPPSLLLRADQIID